MTSRTLKIALAASVALNVFLAAGTATVWLSNRKVETRVETELRSGRNAAVWDAVGAMQPAVREQVKAELRGSALRAHPDFDEARRARREAISLTEQDPFDAVAVAALLEQSRASEMRGRARLEADAVEILGRLDAADRKAMAPLLSRHRGHSKEPKAPATASQTAGAQAAR